MFDVRRVDIECFARDLEDRGKARATVARRLCTVVGFYRYAEEEGVIEHSPAVHIRRPRIDYESHVAHLDRNELGSILVTAGLSSPRDHALVSLLALNGLRVSEAIGANIEALGQERGHRTLTVLRKGGKLVTMPLAPRVARTIDLAIGERLDGPLEPYACGFRLYLGEQGYTPGSARNQLQLMAHASRWLAGRGLAVGDLTAGRIEEFLLARRAEGYTMWLSTKAMMPLVGFLRGLGVVATPVPAGPASPVEELLESYRTYLLHERGLAAGTVADYLGVARLFVATRPADGEFDLEGLCAGEVIDFVRAECSARSVGSAKYVVCGLRSLLRFLHVDGRIESQLAAAVPSVAGWRLSGLPKSLGRGEVARLLASCDRRTTFGRRDFAVLTLLIRLGLRAGEVAALELSDIDWRAGEVVIRGKGRREERLPLPVDVGEALVGWLRRGRPRCESSKAFTRVRAPHGGLSTGGVSAIVQAACIRAGLPKVRAHRLRHTCATEMLRAGAGLAEVGQVLRHVSLLTTAIYAKVDRAALRSLALPWPGNVS